MMYGGASVEIPIYKFPYLYLTTQDGLLTKPQWPVETVALWWCMKWLNQSSAYQAIYDSI